LHQPVGIGADDRQGAVEVGADRMPLALDLGPVDVRAPADRSLPAAKAPGIRSAK